MKMLMVCLGNICRSPIAEGVMKKLIEKHQLNWTVDSAGTNGYHVGEAPHHYSQKVCRKYGIDISLQRSRRFAKEDFNRFDIIYAMSEDVYQQLQRMNDAPKEKIILFLNELNPGSNASVPDPWYGDEKGYLPVYHLIEKTCEAIIKKYK